MEGGRERERSNTSKYTHVCQKNMAAQKFSGIFVEKCLFQHPSRAFHGMNEGGPQTVFRELFQAGICASRGRVIVLLRSAWPDDLDKQHTKKRFLNQSYKKNTMLTKREYPPTNKKPTFWREGMQPCTTPLFISLVTQ
jgi:hypothetical protein